MHTTLILARGVLKELIRRKDFYLIFFFLLVIICSSASLSFGGETGFQRYFKEIGISFAYIFSVVIAVTFASAQIPREIESKTIYPILAHPVSRGDFIIGKFLGVLFVAAASFTLFYAVFIGSLHVKGDLSTPPTLLMQGYLFHICLLSFFVALCLLFSLFLTTTANMGISLILYFATDWFGATLPNYIYLPHPELFDIKDKIIHTQDIIPAWAASFLVLYAVIYTALFLMLAYMVFKKRNL